MQSVRRIWWPVLLAVLFSGCTIRPAPPAAHVAAAPAVTAAGPDGAGIDTALIRRGYQARKINGETKYCRSEPITGSMFSNTVCQTAAEIKARDVSTQGSVDLLGRGRATCFNNKCD